MATDRVVAIAAAVTILDIVVIDASIVLMLPRFLLPLLLSLLRLSYFCICTDVIAAVLLLLLWMNMLLLLVS